VSIHSASSWSASLKDTLVLWPAVMGGKIITVEENDMYNKSRPNTKSHVLRKQSAALACLIAIRIYGLADGNRF